MDSPMKNAEFQEKSVNFLEYLLGIKKAHGIFNIGLDSFINVYMSRRKRKNIIFHIFSTNE